MKRIINSILNKYMDYRIHSTISENIFKSFIEEIDNQEYFICYVNYNDNTMKIYADTKIIKKQDYKIYYKKLQEQQVGYHYYIPSKKIKLWDKVKLTYKSIKDYYKGRSKRIAIAGL